MKNNYDLQQEAARQFFLQYDMAEISRQHGLTLAEGFLRLRYCGEDYAIAQSDGRILRADGSEAGFHEALPIYDLLTRWDGTAQPFGQWATVYSLPHILQSGTARGPAATDGSTRLTESAFRAACGSFGTEVSSKADITYRLPIFGPVEALAQYWRADEEFPAKLQLLWDRNIQAFLHYETIFYVAGHLARRFGLE